MKKTHPLTTMALLFFTLRMTLLILFTPQGLLNAFTDYHFYYRTAEYAEQGRYPFVNMWYEYPPLAAYLAQAAYSMADRIVPQTGVEGFGYQLYVRVLGMMLLAFETGVLIVLHRLVALARDEATADWVGGVYSGLGLPVFYWFATHQMVPVFFLLLAMYLFLRDHWRGSAIALGLGIAAKLTPIFLLAPIIKFMWPHHRRWVAYGAIALGVAAATYAPFFALGGGAWVMASFAALSQVGSWGTVWALLDGNYGPGTYGPLPTRLDLTQAYVPHSNPAVIPGVALLAAFAALYAFVYFRPLNSRAPHLFITLTTFTMLIFHLWSKGWSPQWAVLVLPLFLLQWPDQRGLNLCLGFSFVVFLEWPLMDIIRSPYWLMFTVTIRTLLFVALAALLGRQWWIESSPSLP